MPTTSSIGLDSDLLGDSANSFIVSLLSSFLQIHARHTLDGLLGCLLHRLLNDLFGCLSLGLVADRVIRQTGNIDKIQTRNRRIAAPQY